MQGWLLQDDTAWMFCNSIEKELCRVFSAARLLFLSKNSVAFMAGFVYNEKVLNYGEKRTENGG